MSCEFSELYSAMDKTGAMMQWADKVKYNAPLTQEETEFSECADAWAKEMGRTGCDPNHELAQLIDKALTVDVMAAPSELISRMFEEGSVGEFDDIQGVEEPKNTIQVHEAIAGGNVDRSFIDHKVFKPTWRSLAAETDISYQDLRRGGYRTVANLTAMIREAFEYKRVAMLLDEMDKAIASGNVNYIAEATALPTVASADAMALYLQDMTKDGKPLMFMLNKYRQALAKLQQADRWLTDAQKNMYNTDGVVQAYGGVELMGFSGQRKQPDGTLVIPDKRIFGIADKIGMALTRGETRVLQSEDINQERTHIKVTGYTFGWMITHPEYMAKIVMAQ